MGAIKIILIYVVSVAIAEQLIVLLDILYMYFTGEVFTTDGEPLIVFNGTIAGLFLAYWIARWLLAFIGGMEWW